jgi:hypothetical protein
VPLIKKTPLFISDDEEDEETNVVVPRQQEEVTETID